MNGIMRKREKFESRTKILTRLLAITFVVIFLTSGLSASAAAFQKDDFKMVFNTDGITVGEPDNNGVPITFDSGSFGVRLTYMEPVYLDGLKIVLKNVSIRKGSESDGIGLWMTFSQEAGHYWGDGATGTHIRITSVDTLSFYAKKADAPDEGEGVFYKPTAMALKAFPITTTITVNKVGSNYEFNINKEIIKVDAAKIDSTLSSTGQCYWNFGVTDDKGQSNSFVVSEISNTKQTNTTTSTTTTKVTTITSELADTETTFDGTETETEISDSTSNSEGSTVSVVGNYTTKPTDGKGKKNIIPIIIVLVVLVIGAGAAGTVIFIKRKKNKEI